MKKLVSVLLGASLLMVPAAGAYSINHSYSAAGDATEYHGLCANGDRVVVVEKANGSWKYKGPTGDGTANSGDLDKIARKACGE